MRQYLAVIPALAVLTLGTLQSQAGSTSNTGTQPAKGSGHVHALPAEFAEYDTDGDGVLSTEEKAALKAALEAKRQAFIDKYDTDKDGVLSETELEAAKADRKAALKAERTAQFATIDTDSDGKVTLAELTASQSDVAAARVEALFKHLDADGDGSITLEEFLAKPSGRPGKHRK